MMMMMTMTSPMTQLVVLMLQKVRASQGGATLDSQSEHVIRIIERPSLLAVTSPAQYPQTDPANSSSSPLVPSLLPPQRPPPSSSVVRGVAEGRDINHQLVERIDELYRQLHQTEDNAEPTAV